MDSKQAPFGPAGSPSLLRSLAADSVRMVRWYGVLLWYGVFPASVDEGLPAFTCGAFFLFFYFFIFGLLLTE